MNKYKIKWITSENSHKYEIYDNRTYFDNLRQLLFEEDYCFSGDVHQSIGIPVLLKNNKPMLTYYVSMRTWGGLMADIWNEKLGSSYNYMDFYMESLMPKELVKKLPNGVE